MDHRPICSKPATPIQVFPEIGNQLAGLMASNHEFAEAKDKHRRKLINSTDNEDEGIHESPYTVSGAFLRMLESCGGIVKSLMQIQPIRVELAGELSFSFEFLYEPEIKIFLKVQPGYTEFVLKVQPGSADSALKVQPGSPESPLKVQPGSPESALKVQPGSPESALKVQPGSPESMLKVQPGSPESVLKVQLGLPSLRSR